MFYNYGYDQLNRLTRMDAYNGFTPDSNSWTGNGGMMNPLDIWKERIAYDANGNILKYKRNGAAGGFPLEMDSLVYNYYSGTNKLKYIHDSVPAAAYPNAEYFSDLDKQPDNNYVYDAIGNLIKDSSEGITSIKWSVYGKILEINKNATNPSLATRIIFTYDAHSLPRHSGGNRISKTTEQAGNNYKKIDWYVRDAQGNTIAIYTAEGGLSANLSDITPKVSEWHIYGSSLLGTYNKEEGMNYGPGRWSWQSIFNNYPRGLRRYQLSNHLGNVEAVITDKKIAVPSDTNSSLIAYYKPDINAAEDYYPFGWAMPGRTWEADRLYRYGFNGKEYDNDVKGKWGQQDYGMRIYDPRVGRFLSVDPLQAKYAGLTPYQFSSNGPIANIDLDGLEKYYYALTFNDKGQPKLTLTGTKDYSELRETGGTYYTLDGSPIPELADVTNPTKRYYVQFSYDTYAVTEAVAVPYKENVEVEFNADPTKMNVTEVVGKVDKEVIKQSHWNEFRLGFAGGLGTRRPGVPRLNRLKGTVGSATLQVRMNRL